MRISELIKELEIALEYYHDLDVAVVDPEGDLAPVYRADIEDQRPNRFLVIKGES